MVVAANVDIEIVAVVVVVAAVVINAVMTLRGIQFLFFRGNFAQKTPGFRHGTGRQAGQQAGQQAGRSTGRVTS